MSSRVIAASLDISKTALLALLRERNVQVRVRLTLGASQVDQAVELYSSGLLLREVAERFGVSRDCVRLALKRRGIKLRPGLGARQPKS